MHITPIAPDLDLGASSLVRSPGLHVSTLYNDLYQDLEPGRYGWGAPLDMRRIELGFSLEEMLEEGLKRRMASRPGEFRTKEGIAFSPDLLIFNGGVRLGEIKLSWKSSREVPRVAGTRHFPPKFDKWFTQMQAYCHHLETPLARLYGFFVNGDYSTMTPEFLAWDIEFTPDELRTTWTQLLNYGRSRKLL